MTVITHTFDVFEVLFYFDIWLGKRVFPFLIFLGFGIFDILQLLLDFQCAVLKIHVMIIAEVPLRVYIVAGLLKCCKLQISQEKNISQTGFENFGKMQDSKMYVNLNIFVNSSEIKTLTFLDYPRTYIIFTKKKIKQNEPHQKLWVILGAPKGEKILLHVWHPSCCLCYYNSNE